MLLRLVVSPNARQSAFEWTADGQVRARIAARPVDGRANRELVRALAVVLDVPMTSVHVAKGMSSRHKTVEIDGLDEAEVRRRLGAPDLS